MLYEDLVESLNIKNHVHRYKPEDPHFWRHASEFLIASGYFEEGIDLIIEYQKKLKFGGFHWLPNPPGDDNEFPYDHFLYYITKLISSLEECRDYKFFSENLHDLRLIFNSKNQHFWDICKYLGKKETLPYPFEAKVSPQKKAEFKHTSEININQEDLMALSCHFIKTISKVINSNNFQVNENKDGNCLRLILVKCFILFLISNNIDKYEETLLAFHEILRKDKLSFKYIISSYLNHLVDNEKYKKALETIDFLIDNGYYNDETNELNRVKIYIMIRNNMFQEAEHQYRTLGELEKAIVMYKNAGMLEKAAKIYEEIEKSKNECKNCGKKLLPDEDFCMGCGTQRQRDQAFCQNCKIELPPGAKFCKKCGAKLGNESY